MYKKHIETESNIHIHNKSLRPCKNFITFFFNIMLNANFDHTILSQGQHICYKCGEVSKNKANMINHIKSTHGQELCEKERHKKMILERDVSTNPVQSVVQNLWIPPTVFTQQIFSNLPNTGHQTSWWENRR